MKLNYYQILEVNENSSTREIEQAYQEIQKQHPNPTNEKWVANLYKAFETLTDERLRSEHDKELLAEKQKKEQSPSLGNRGDSASSQTDSVVKEVNRLFELVNSGALSNDEFILLKEKLIDKTHDVTLSKPAADYGIFLLAIPVISTMLVWLWVANMNLFQSPQSSLGLILAFTILGTAILASLEASKVEMINASPTTWFFAFILIWIIAYPMYLYKRKYYGLANNLVIGTVVALVLTVSCAIVDISIEKRKAEISSNLENIQHQMDSLKNSFPYK